MERRKNYEKKTMKINAIQNRDLWPYQPYKYLEANQ